MLHQQGWPGNRGLSLATFQQQRMGQAMLMPPIVECLIAMQWGSAAPTSEPLQSAQFIVTGQLQMAAVPTYLMPQTGVEAVLPFTVAELPPGRQAS